MTRNTGRCLVVAVISLAVVFVACSSDRFSSRHSEGSYAIAYKPQVPVGALSGWTHQSADYYWKPGIQQTEHPHLHLNGSTVSGVVTINFLVYSTGGQGGNITLKFSPDSGFPSIKKEIPNQKAFNLKIEDLNEALLREEE